MSYHGMLPLITNTDRLAKPHTRDAHTHTNTMRNALAEYLVCLILMSMGIVGVNSTAGREVKFIDPSKTTKSESSWLGYTLCDF